LNVQEAILFSNESILAQAGKMQADEIDECSRLISKFGKEQNATELIKHFQLKTSGRTHFLHATVLAVGIILTLLYDADMPIKVVRGHTRYLTNILRNPLLAKSDLLTLPQITELGSEISALKTSSPVTPQSVSTNAAPKHRHPRPAMLDSDLQKAPVQTMLDEEIVTPEFTPVSTYESKISSRSQSVQVSHTVGQRDTATMVNEVQVQSDKLNRQSSEWVPAFLDGAAPAGKGSPSGSRFFLRSVEPSLADVIYPCVLIPRLKHQSLEGEVKDYLKEELPNIFLAFGWRLESFVIDGAYLQWLARIPPTIAPATHIKIIRTQTSQGILTNFANLNRDNMLKDFWAPGYLLGSGLRLLPADAIAEFIKMNRRQHYLEENTFRVSDVNYPSNHDYWSQSKLNPI
jgi:REP element-mobilizing transposase RayT